MRVLVLCLKAFETMEFSVFIDVMGWAHDDFECDVQVETCGFHQCVHSAFNIPVMMDKIITDICVSDYDALAIPGGVQEYGFYDEAYDEKTLDLIREFNRLDKIIATVCVAAFPLAKSGVLLNKTATTYHLRGGFKQRELADLGVNVVNEPVVVDHNIITSYCPQTAPYVAFRLLEMLISKEKTQLVKEAMGY